ncbi:MAG TPA: NHL repeat-containing protein [Nitrospinota bacterium]|nr:NHL repeat-containing protein [Nitrospinota bacterium]
MNKYKILSIIFILFCLAPPYLFSADLNLIASLSGDKIMGKFNQPSAIFFDELKKRLYVADTGNNRLVSFDHEFNFISEFDAGGELKYPTSIVKNSKDQFFVVGGTARDELFLIDIPKKIFKQIEIKNITARENPFLPDNLAIDKDDNLYITDRGNGRILVVDSDGRFLKEIAVENKFVDLTDVQIDTEGNIYSLSTLEGKVYIFNNKEGSVSSFGKRGSRANEFEFPVSIAISPNRFVYVLDKHKGNVLVFKKDGNFQFNMLKKGWGNGEIYEPSYIYIDRGNKIYIVDRGNNRIQIFQGGK